MSFPIGQAAKKLADELEANLEDKNAFAERGMIYEAMSVDEIELVVAALRAYAQL